MVTQLNQSPGRKQAPNAAYFLSETWKPCIPPLHEDSSSQELPEGMQVWEVGKSEFRSVIERIRVSKSPDTKVCPRPTGLSLQENLENRSMEKSQMTELNSGAPPAGFKNWDSVDWSEIEKHVRWLQVRIAKATKEGRTSKAKSLQWLLTHSYFAKLLAVKRVTETKGRKFYSTIDLKKLFMYLASVAYVVVF